MAGGIVGALILLIGGILGCLFIRKRRRTNALYLSSRPDSPFRDVEQAIPRNGTPVFSIVNAERSAPSSVAPSIIVDAPSMTQVSTGSSQFQVHKKPAPSFTEEDLAALETSSAPDSKTSSYVLDVDLPTTSVPSMAFDKTAFGQSLQNNADWAALLAPKPANPFEDPVNPFADPKPATRVSQMPEIPKHLRMSTTSSTLSREGRPVSSTSTIYQDGMAM